MTDRQQTGIWFTITGILLLSLWVFSYAIVNYLFDINLLALNGDSLSDEHLYTFGASCIAALQLASLTGIPLLITGIAQTITGRKKAKKSSKK